MGQSLRKNVLRKEIGPNRVHRIDIVPLSGIVKAPSITRVGLGLFES